jgi:hypothetical protein
VKRAFAGLIAMATPGCVWGPGEPFGEIAVALDAAWVVPADRDLGGGWQKLASDYEIMIDSATWTTTSLLLIETGEAALNFDPANPPPGYTLCHSGHCHADDGRLVPYEEIAAELAGGAPPAPALELPTGALDLIAGGRLDLGCDGAPCPLGRGEIGRIELVVTGAMLSGRVRDGRAPPRIPERGYDATIAFGDPVHPTGRLDLPIDRVEPPHVVLDVQAAPTPAVLDGVEWSALTGNPLDVAADPDAVSAIAIGIGEVELLFAIRRTE